MWFKIRSWHLMRPDKPKAYCGQIEQAGKPRALELPLTEKSCESCLRLSAHEVKI